MIQRHLFDPSGPSDYPLVWRVRARPLFAGSARLGDRYGQRCRVLVSGALNSVLVEFADGYRVITSRHYVRAAR